jgi:hypothetical protein
VGDSYPADPGDDQTGDGDADDCLEFGNDAISWMDVVSVYYCFTGTECPELGSARHDAMDAYPEDQVDAQCEAVARGGDGVIGWMDAVLVYYTYVEDPPCKPRRSCGH